MPRTTTTYGTRLKCAREDQHMARPASGPAVKRLFRRKACENVSRYSSEHAMDGPPPTDMIGTTSLNSGSNITIFPKM
jgi:hypothetical protein